MDGRLVWEGVCRQVGDDDAKGFVGDEQAQAGAGEREQKRLGE